MVSLVGALITQGGKEMDEMTYIDLEDGEGVWNCDNCGAYDVVKGKDKPNIKHHATCKPGEAKYWEKFYGENES
jgi:hypothetical protein